MNQYEINTAQTGPHHDLVTVVHRFKQTIYRRPIPDSQAHAFTRVINFCNDRSRPLIIDSGCGTGLSTQMLAEQFLDHDVIGIDKSSHRLARSAASMSSNFLLVRADLLDMWRMLVRAKLPIARHYLLYPNPWPKIGHLKRRFHAHPIFSTMLSVAPYFELRTNWRIYAEEMMIALKIFGQQPSMSIKTDQNYLSLFEKKYLATGSEIMIVKNHLLNF